MSQPPFDKTLFPVNKGNPSHLNGVSAKSEINNHAHIDLFVLHLFSSCKHGLDEYLLKYNLQLSKLPDHNTCHFSKVFFFLIPFVNTIVAQMVSCETAEYNQMPIGNTHK